MPQPKPAWLPQTPTPPEAAERLLPFTAEPLGSCEFVSASTVGTAPVNAVWVAPTARPVLADASAPRPLPVLKSPAAPVESDPYTALPPLDEPYTPRPDPATCPYTPQPEPSCEPQTPMPFPPV